jgi:hypothetical protein
VAEKKRRDGSGRQVDCLDVDALFEWILGIHRKARYVAVRLGKLLEWLEGEPDTVRRITANLDALYETFSDPDIGQRII